MTACILVFAVLSLDPLCFPIRQRGETQGAGCGNISTTVPPVIWFYSYGLTDRVDLSLCLLPGVTYSGTKVNLLSRDRTDISLGAHYGKGDFELPFLHRLFISILGIYGAYTKSTKTGDLTVSPQFFFWDFDLPQFGFSHRELRPLLFLAYHGKVGSEGLFYLESLLAPGGGVLVLGAGSREDIEFGGSGGLLLGTSGGETRVIPYLKVSYNFGP